MKSLTYLVQEVLSEEGTWCRISTIRDSKTIADRVKGEGLSFLTITLPGFGSDLQKGLDQGWVDSQLFQGFSFGRGGLPLFLGGFLGLIFDRETGRLLDEPSIDAIRAVRQITLMCSKVLIACSDRRREKAIRKYIECEKSVRQNDASLSESDKDRFEKMSSLLWATTLQPINNRIADGYPLPKHGPGSTAEKLLGNKKFKQTEWPKRLDYVFPHGEYLFPNQRYYDPLRVDILEPGAERPVRVITVPKTLKTPRIIAIEPTCMQYTQQSLLQLFVDTIENTDNVSSIVGFTDQTPNQRFAQQGSSDGTLATLDLSEASDRVSNQLVRLMTRRFPMLHEAIDACRSRKADVPGHGVIRLAKFASMGSALCFPIEAMVFATVVFLGIQKALNRPLTRKDVKFFSSRVRIYGDDIIIPVDFVHSVVSELQTFGFVVNADKSFWTGKFRESCGKEYYDGHDVSVVKVRRDLPAHRRHVQEIISTVSLRNQLYQAGLWGTARELDNRLGRVIPFPAVLPTSPVLGRHSYLGYDQEKLGTALHNPLVKGCVTANILPKSNLGEDAALLKWFLKRGSEPFADKNHLERAGRPDSVDIKIRWASAV